MTEGVVVALISTGGAILVALIGLMFQNAKQGRLISRVHSKTEVVRDQVQNSHGTNLREDLDLIRDEMRDGFKSVHERQDEAARTVVEVRREAHRDADAVDQKVVDLTKRFDRHIDAGAK